MINFCDAQLSPFIQSGRIIYFSQDMYGRLLVIDDGKRRVLSFDSIFEQSCMRIEHPYQLAHQYTQLMVLSLAFVEPTRVLLLGLGGGSLLRTLHHVLPDCYFHVIELRETVVQIARDYFFLPNDERVKITVNDALQEIVNIKDNSIDLLFSDMYDAYQMIPEQTQKYFLLDCSRILSDRGWLIINLLHLPADSPAFFQTLGEVFPTIFLCNSKENTVLLVSKSAPETICRKVQRIKVIEDILQQRFSHLMSRLKPHNFDALDLPSVYPPA